MEYKKPVDLILMLEKSSRMTWDQYKRKYNPSTLLGLLIIHKASK